MCSSCSSDNDQLLTMPTPTPTRFPDSPRAGNFIHNHSSTSSPSFQILPRSLLSSPSNRVTRALRDIYLMLDIRDITDLKGRKPLWLYMHCKI